MFNFCIWGPLHSLIPNQLLVLTLFLLCHAINILAEDWFQTIPHVSIFLPSRIWKYYTIHLEELCDIDFLSNRWEVFRYKILSTAHIQNLIVIRNVLILVALTLPYICANSLWRNSASSYQHLLLPSLYGVSDHANYMFSVRIWSLQYVIAIFC